jgi:hypothetical protein
MTARQPIYLEEGTKRVFAGGIDWPGWCRSGRDGDAAMAALVAYGPRYAGALGRVAAAFTPPGVVSALEVIEHVEGNATTDFGAPGVAPAADDAPVEAADLDRLVGLLRACWAAFDAAADANAGVELRKGPRGGGRDVAAMVSHVLDADRAYLSGIGGAFRAREDAAVADRANGIRAAMIDALGARARGEPPPPSRRRNPLWSPRYCVRRSAWHALDHAWEIEDRATPE